MLETGSNYARLEHSYRAGAGINLDIHTQRNRKLLVYMSNHAAAESGHTEWFDVFAKNLFQGE